MAGGSFLAQDKIRPGAYINFKAAPQQTINVGIRGIVALPLTLSWGVEDTVIPLTVNEFMRGDSLTKIGVSFADQTETAQILREAFKGAYKALLFKINKGGSVATGTLATGIIASAKHSGTVGNDISVTIVDNGSDFTIKTLYKGAVKDSQTVIDETDFIENDWIKITGTGSMVAVASIPLTGGTDVVGTDANYVTFFNALMTERWQTVAVLSSTVAASTAETFIRNMREAEGRYVQAVVNNVVAPNYEGVINTKNQGYVMDTGETISPDVFLAWVAGMTAGAQLNQSNTYRVIDGAVSIINPLGTSAIEQALQDGFFVITARSDGAIVVEDDVNSLTSFTVDRPEDWARNRVVRTMDDLATQVRMIFENNYIGKVDNDANGRSTFKTHLISLFNAVQGLGAIQNFDSKNDIVILAGTNINSVVANLGIQPVDSMTKLYATFTLR